MEVVHLKGHIFLVLFLFFFLGMTKMQAQRPRYTVAGVVHDTTGGRIPGAEVTLQPDSTAAPLIGTTDAQGSFQLAVPLAGVYHVAVKAARFAAYRGETAVSDAAPQAHLDVTLVAGGGAETVEVTADALTAETTSTQLGETLESKKMEAVPLNGRNFTDLMAVEPGIVPVNTAQPGAVIMTGVASTPPSGNANPGTLSISGQREDSNGFRVNGADAEEDVNMGTSIMPDLDSIASFRVLTSNFDAEYGNSSGGEVMVTTKSGTPQWHGDAFDFLRNTDLDARNYFSSLRAAYRQNQFGATLGGTPFHKNLALFGDYQGTRLTEGIDTGDISVPSAAERRGDFSQAPLTGSVNGSAWAAHLSSLLGETVTPGEPYAQVFPTGRIPQSIWSTPAKALLAAIPPPNAGSAVFETASAAETLEDNKGSLRADWSHGHGTLTGYYFLDSYSLDNPYPTGTGGASVPGFDATSNGLAQLFTVQHTATFGASMLNEAQLSFMRNANSVGQPRGGVGPSLAAQGFSGIVPLQPSTEGVENIAFNDYTLGVDTTALVQVENIYEAMDKFSRIVGRHGLKFGGEMQIDQINTHPDVIFNGSFAFNGTETGVDFADFLLGVASSYTQGQAGSFYNRNLYMAAFAQDSWRATDHLIVNYGVRWDRIRPWLEKYNQLQTLVAGEQSQVFPGAPRGLVFPGDPGIPRSLAPPRDNFSPRIGIAYSPAGAAGSNLLDKLLGNAGSTSLRLGYGLYYTAYEGLSAGIMSANPPYGYTYTSAAPPLFAEPFTVAATNASVVQPFPLQRVPFGASRAHPNASVDWSQFEPLVGIPAVAPNDVTPYAQHWMTSFERQLGAATLVTLSYTGASAHHLLVLEEANPANPALCLSLGSACGPFNEQLARTVFGPSFGSVELQRTIANSSYNALDATLNHRTHGFDLLASYTYAKSIDQSAGLPEPVNPVNPSLSRGLSAFDMRHNFVASFDYLFPVRSAKNPLHGVEFAGIARLTTGLPITLLNNNDTSLLGTIPNGINDNGVDTPNWSGQSLHIHTNPRGGVPVFDASQFGLPALGTMGNARRRFFSGPGMEDLDATLARRFFLGDDRSLELRAEAFNVLNHAQFFGPASVEGNISSGTFGQAVSAMPPRLMQIAARIRF
ncbi:TonB-dependent receptor [Pseudacidobacterium ailaaui]|uniref:TonB-dependent receptor n=1 Tax=Pseudacidobacterium ailaaui TaxID=1382359 RepID=UPI0012DE5583|nr:carboxypeptidase regulatory-like domain-containing protein [Pseudacidobacterium ailaaui]